MADDRKRRQQLAAAAFLRRRLELDLTQEEVAQRSGVVVRTVQNFESQGKWPNTATRAGFEAALGWPSGEIKRLREPPPRIDAHTRRLFRQHLSDEEYRAVIELLEGRRATEPGEEENGENGEDGQQAG